MFKEGSQGRHTHSPGVAEQNEVLHCGESGEGILGGDEVVINYCCVAFHLTNEREDSIVAHDS